MANTDVLTSEIILLYAEEAVAGDGTTPAIFVPFEEDSFQDGTKTSRTQYEMGGTGSPYRVIGTLESVGDNGIGFKSAWYPGLTDPLLSSCGLATGVAPKSLCFGFGDGTLGSTKYPGMTLASATLTGDGSSNTPWMWDFKFEGIKDPTPGGAALTKPVIAAVDPYDWPSITSIGLIGEAASGLVTRATWNFMTPNATGRGSKGQRGPTKRRNEAIKATGDISAFFASSARYADALAHGGTGGSITLVLTKGAHTATITIPVAVYVDPNKSPAKGGYLLETMQWLAKSSDTATAPYTVVTT